MPWLQQRIPWVIREKPVYRIHPRSLKPRLPRISPAAGNRTTGPRQCARWSPRAQPLAVGIGHLDIGEGMCTAVLADQHGITLGEKFRALLCSPGDLDQSTVSVLTAARRRFPSKLSCCAYSCRDGSSWCRYPPAAYCWSAPPNKTRPTLLSPRRTQLGISR